MQTNNHESEFPGELHGVPATLFSLALILSSLSTVFSESVIFAGITVFVLASLIFSYAREAVPVLGILIPALFIVVATGNLSLPAVYIGSVFSFGVSVYLMIGKKSFRIFASVLSAYIAAAVVLGPIEALPVLIPSALGILASPMLRRRSLAESIAVTTLLLLCGALIAFLAVGGDLAAGGEAIRAQLTELYGKLNEKANVIELRAVQMLAAYFVNVLPGMIFAAASAVCYLGVSLAAALFRSSTHIDVPESMAKISLSPVSGAVYILCFLLSTAFAIEGEAYEMAGAVTENILIGTSLPFFIMGCDSIRGFFARFSPVGANRGGKAAFPAIAILFFISPDVALTVLTVLGVIKSIRPITHAVFARFIRPGNKEQ
jgi:hypothetical protein